MRFKVGLSPSKKVAFIGLNESSMRVPKRPIVFRFKNEKRKRNFMSLNHSFSKIKMKMKNKIER